MTSTTSSPAASGGEQRLAERSGASDDGSAALRSGFRTDSFEWTGHADGGDSLSGGDDGGGYRTHA